MAEYKVLGASPKNLKALQNALTINGGKSTNGQATADLKFKDQITEAEIEVPPTGVFIPLAVSGQLMWFPISGFGILSYSENYSEELSTNIHSVDVIPTPLSGDGRFILTNFDDETSGYHAWVQYDDCDSPCVPSGN